MQKKMKRGRKGKKSSSPNSTAIAASEVSHDMFSDFQNGLLVTSSPGASRVNDTNLRSSISLAEENSLLAEEAINLRYNWLTDIESSELGRTEIWNGDCSLIEYVQKIMIEVRAEKRRQFQDGSTGPSLHAVGKTVTFSTNQQSTNRTIRNHRKSRSVSPFRTPGINQMRSHSAGRCLSGRDGFSYNIATVTPHVRGRLGGNCTPPPILRKPNFGETAISMAGSPLLVHSDMMTSAASLQLSLADGRVFAVQGNDPNVVDQLRPGLQRETVNQLRELNAFISKLI